MAATVVWVGTVFNGPSAALPTPVADRGRLALTPITGARWQFDGCVGRRVEVNVRQWLLPAPEANPGMLEMFRLRDRQPVTQLVPWAGEFAGKYLISAVLAARMSETPELRPRLAAFVRSLLELQAEDGYLGPFPRAERLLGHWDLWGHYHVMQGLLLWYEDTGDSEALMACRRMADLMCRTYLDQPRRVYDAGSHEMNMAIIHGLGRLYRQTGEARYLRLMQEIEKDWERAGDYLRTGLAGTEFYRTPRPRWESLHDLQGLVELWRITGKPAYREAFIRHWRNIARLDRHNTGGFSSGEQATGNPFATGAIETCCTVAWMALSVDMLSLTGDPRVADELELATLNAGLGAQHPSGRWWTYNTPMNGVREASAHTIVFQARAGTPELNCCSVNGPRIPGLLSQWAVMSDTNRLALHWHGPGRHELRWPDGRQARLRCEGDYPFSGRVRWVVEEPSVHRFTLRFRMPAWTTQPRVRVAGGPWVSAEPGTYFDCTRQWNAQDTVGIAFDLPWRRLMGDRGTAGCVSLYRGPILLAWDQRFNDQDEPDLPPVALDRLDKSRVSITPPGSDACAPWLRVELDGQRTLTLCDFASAGATGTRYRSWLPVANAPPPSPIARAPADRSIIGKGATTFRWTTRTNRALTNYVFAIAEDREFRHPVAQLTPLTEPRATLDASLKQSLRPDRWYFWRVVAQGPGGETPSLEPQACFRFDPRMTESREQEQPTIAPDGVVLRVPLRGECRPLFGTVLRQNGFEPCDGPDKSPTGAVRLNGRDQMLVFVLPELWEDDFSVAVWVRLRELPNDRLGQVFSAWAGPMDDPLRLTVERGKLFARIEAQQAYSTEGIPIAPGSWHHLAAVKTGNRLQLFLDGKPRTVVTVPATVTTQALSCALGGNPNYGGNEFLAADFAEFLMMMRTMTEQEIQQLSSRP